MKTKLLPLEIWKFILPLMLLCCISKSNAQCSTDVLTLLTQADVDNFGTTYSSVTEWDGSIQVGDYDNNSNITNLNGFSNLISICGSLTISNNPSLPNLNGLGNLNSVATLNLTRNNSLINLNGLGNLSITSDLYINQNPSMTSLNGLNLLNTSMENISILEDPMIENLDSLQSLTVVNYISIGYNQSLNNLEGLSNLVTVTELLMIGIGGCPNLTNVDALQSLTSVGIFQLEGGNISNLNGLVNLQSAGELYFYGFNLLENLSGLENLTSLKSIDLDTCPVLNSIEALENVVFMDYDPATDSYPPYIYIGWNPMLTECSIAPICEKITNPDFIVIVEENALGCESVEAIVEECENLGVAEISLNSVKIFPNPSNSVVNIPSSDITQVKIFDMMGKKVFDAKIENNSVNVEKLAAGRYVAQLIGNSGEVVMENLIVN